MSATDAPERPTDGPIAIDTGVELRPDPSRVITRLFVAGREDIGHGDSRATPVLERLLQLDEASVEVAMRDVTQRFQHRHHDFDGVLAHHAAIVSSRIDDWDELSPARVLLIGAAFTHEYSIEAAALCNPSAVLHPVQDGPDDGSVSFLMSVRGIGEGHRSSIGFRTGHLAANGEVTIDAPDPFPRTGATTRGRHHRSVFHAKLAELGDDRENAAYVLDALEPVFDDEDLDERIAELKADTATRRLTLTTVTHLDALAMSSYHVTFDAATTLTERVLWPHAPVERHGMEDARFVRFVAEDRSVTYYGTYTAFDGTSIAQHLLETTDFRTFGVSPMAGDAAVGKGLALFPRQVGGRFVALSRCDRETNSISFSDDIRCWPAATMLQQPSGASDVLQLGNCGSPIETSAGWLVLTHGVGPMRTYTLSAILLDLAEPQHVIARCAEPIIMPGNGARRDGYVPNVIYSCGGFAHGDTLVLPYGIGDQTIAVATISLERLLGVMVREH